MKLDSQNKNNTNNIINHLMAEKKKVVMVLGLVVLMTIMWIRVLGKGGPDSANASVSMPVAKAEKPENTGNDVSFVKLPVIAGRNDILTKNVFEVKNWQSFMSGSNSDLNQVNKNEKTLDEIENSNVEMVSKNLILDAIELGNNPKAFINGQLLSVGDKFSLRIGENIFECRIKEVAENLVVVNFNSTDISLRLTQKAGFEN
ncbi:MAG TPA: hypothetical protein PLP05_05045 [Sedimentisphaerales bacterium]|nr:hypothetical protein [Sedimentisphaerales bacterium]